MKRQIFLLGIGLITILSLDSCTHYYYAPTSHNIPVFKEKNEVRASVGLIKGDEVTGCDIQAAYAMTKESAILANASIIDPGQAGGHGQLYELGAGYFKPIPSSNTFLNHRFVFEVYGICGIGNAKNYYGNTGFNYNEYPDYYISANLLKGYIQPSIAFSTNFIDVIASGKIGVLHSFGVKRHMPDSVYNAQGQNNSDGQRTVVDDVRILNANKASFFFEPAVTLRLGYKYVKFQFQAGWSVIASDFQKVSSSPVFNFGITVDVAKRFRLKNDRPAKEKWKDLFFD
ncbi:MAG: hypothetical protein JWO03_2753 [Bacteroidetes bacterium]|nr:hypothetical protein [Bacteroidota bacterium]